VKKFEAVRLKGKVLAEVDLVSEERRSSAVRQELAFLAATGDYRLAVRPSARKLKSCARPLRWQDPRPAAAESIPGNRPDDLGLA
jgi:hypothetical protein